MDVIMQGIQPAKEATDRRLVPTAAAAGPSTAAAAAAATRAEAEEDDAAQPTWRMRVKSITGRSRTIIVDSTNASRQPVPLGAIVAMGRPQPAINEPDESDNEN